MGNIGVDFTDVESRELLPEGEYAVEVVDIEEKEGDKGPYLNWEFRVVIGQFKGRKIWNVTSLAAQSLWVLKNTLIALGVDPGTGKFTLNPMALKGLKMGVKLVHREFDKKTRAKVSDVFPLNELVVQDNQGTTVTEEEEADTTDEKDEE
jgi:hypothetical protein